MPGSGSPGSRCGGRDHSSSWTARVVRADDLAGEGRDRASSAPGRSARSCPLPRRGDVGHRPRRRPGRRRRPRGTPGRPASRRPWRAWRRRASRVGTSWRHHDRSSPMATTAPRRHGRPGCCGAVAGVLVSEGGSHPRGDQGRPAREGRRPRGPPQGLRAGLPPSVAGDLLRTYYQRVAPEDVVRPGRGRPVRRAGLALPAGHDPAAGHRQRAGVHPQRPRARLVRGRPLGGRGRHRRHAVPRRLGDHGPGRRRSAPSTWSSTRCSRRCATSPASCWRSPDGASGSTPEDLEAGHEVVRESWMHIEIDRVSDEDDLAEIEAALHRVLRDVRDAVEDWPRMQSRLLDIVGELEEHPPPLPERGDPPRHRAAALAGRRPLRVPRLPGVPPRSRTGRSSRCTALPATGLGILRGDQLQSSAFQKLPGPVRERAREPKLLVLAKANSMATVHRSAYLDYVGVKKFDESGTVVGERRFLGLFSAATYTESVMRIPMLREKVDRRCCAHSGVDAEQPRGQDPGQRAGELPARRAVPHADRGAGADRRGGDAHPRAPAAAALHPARHLRPLRVLPGLPARATATTPRSARRSPPSCATSWAPRTSSSPCGSTSPTWPRCTSWSARRAARSSPSSTSPSWSASSRRRPGPGGTT